nr:hypothetical protein HmN_000944400 [Hymenolepis microstoma]
MLYDGKLYFRVNELIVDSGPDEFQRSKTLTEWAITLTTLSRYKVGLGVSCCDNLELLALNITTLCEPTLIDNFTRPNKAIVGRGINVPSEHREVGAYQRVVDGVTNVVDGYAKDAVVKVGSVKVDSKTAELLLTTSVLPRSREVPVVHGVLVPFVGEIASQLTEVLTIDMEVVLSLLRQDYTQLGVRVAVS